MSTADNDKKLPFFTEGIVAWLPSMDYFYRNFYTGAIRWNYSSLDNPQLTESPRPRASSPTRRSMRPWGVSSTRMHFDLMPQVPLWQPSQDAVMAPTSKATPTSSTGRSITAT